MAVGIFVATWAEALPLLDRRPTVTGMGQRAYELGSCSAVLSAGFAGACQADLHPGSVLVVGELAPDLALVLNAIDGELRTLEHIGSVSEKVELGKHGVAAVDMETEHLAMAAADRGIPFLGVRVIIDRLNDSAFSFRTALNYPMAAGRLRRAVIQALKRWPATGTIEPLS